MLTRSEAQERALSDNVLLPLPRCFVRAVFVLLPVGARLRCCEVSRAWRALLADTSLWSSIYLSITSGVARFSEALLRAAAAKAGGQLRVLNLTGRWVSGRHGNKGRPLLEIVVANATTVI